MYIQKISVAAALTLLLAGCSHSGRNQYAEVPMDPVEMEHSKGVYMPEPISPGSMKDGGDVQGKVIYEEPPRNYTTQDLPPDIVDEFRREFRNQPTSTSDIGGSRIREGLQRISTRGELPQLLEAHETYMGDAPYQLDTGDRIRISVYEQAELSRVYSVDGSGRIAMPLIGSVRVRGRTTRSVAGIIRNALSRDYVKDPKVTVEVQEYRPFYVMGEVKRGGRFSFQHGMTVRTAVAIAGGYSPRANEGYAVVTRNANGQTMTAKVGAQTPIMPGDIVKIEERWF